MKFKTSQDAAAKRRELLDRQSSINDNLNALDETLAQRELTEQERTNRAALQREFSSLQREIDVCAREYTALYQSEQAEREAKHNAPIANACQQLRELLKGVRATKGSREITLNPVSGNANGSIADAGAINLTVHDIIPTLNEGLGLPVGLRIVTGVVGNEVWPVSLDDAEVQEIGENVALNAQDLHFDNIKPSAARCGIAINVSNQAIDNAAFDLLGFVQQKFTVAMRKFLATKIYSQAAFTGIKGPFSGMTPTGTITLGSGAYKEILKAVAAIADKGYDAEQVCLVMDKATEADLKATPKADGQGGFVIENGKCAGYDYVTSHLINTTLGDGNTVKATTDRFIGIGLFAYEAVQQHGEVRLSIDAISQSVALKNVTSIVLNTSWSMTDLSVKTTTNGGKNTKTTAFALYKVAEATKVAASGN